MKTYHKLALVALAGAASTMATEAMAKEKMNEKCYGVAKEGKNDCGNSKHSCMGQAKMDADKSEWVYVPKGLCEKLAGGSLMPKES